MLPSYERNSDHRNIICTLQVVKDLNGRIDRIPNFQKSVVTIRKQLMGVDTTAPETNR